VNGPTTMEMIPKVDDDPEVRRALDARAVIHAELQLQLKYREDRRLVVEHTWNQHVPAPPALAAMDVPDARRELAAADRAIKDLERARDREDLRIDQARSVVSARRCAEVRPWLQQRMADIERAEQTLAAEKAALMADIDVLEDAGVRGLTAFRAAAR
jgi:multidrug resistance efflux pump